MAFTEPRRFMTTSEVAPFLGGRANPETVLKLIHRGELKAKKVCREWRILPEWLDEYMSKPDTVDDQEE